MKVILSQDVDKLGKIGDLISVKEGFARNFLIPQKKACVATPESLRRIAQMKLKQKSEQERLKKEAEDFAKKLSGVSCTVNVEV
ncbi:MAG: 50S ribosomal protein L9, partial [Candidatus Omnitrophica bacterium]|nr:50S ribosomal protein L9 [Candidatus Omnitrophota bacterium]